MRASRAFGNVRYPIPSPRRSIHSEDLSATIGEDMARYGDESSDDESQARADAGLDEVDNVMSKFSRTSSPVSVRRTNSLSSSELLYTDYDGEHNALAKSLPASLSPRSNYSSTSGASARARDYMSRTSLNLNFATRSSNVSYRFNQSGSTNVSPIISQSSREREKSFGIGKYILGLLALLVGMYFVNSSLKCPHPIYDEERFNSDLNELGAKYKVDHKSILQLQAGISTIFEKEDTSCVIFLYNSQKNDFDPSKFDGFVNNVVSNAAKFLRNETAPVEHRVLEGAEIDMRSHTQLVQAYQDDIAKAGVMLVRDVPHVRSSLAMAFHYYCDEYQPLVRKSAIFFTMNTANCDNSGAKSAYAYVEKCLKKTWNTVPKDNIGPLLTRVVSIVVDVNSGV